MADYTGGLMGVVKKSIDTNVTTFIGHAGAFIHDDVAELNRDFYEGYQWVAALDTVTCLKCAALDNLIFAAGPGQDVPEHTAEGVIPEAAPEYPAHENCRCMLVPVLVGDAKNTASGPNYQEWFEKRSEPDKLKILGPARYKLYKEKGLQIVNFVRSGEILTLEQLKINRITRSTLYKTYPDARKKGKKGAKPPVASAAPPPVPAPPAAPPPPEKIRNVHDYATLIDLPDSAPDALKNFTDVEWRQIADRFVLGYRGDFGRSLPLELRGGGIYDKNGSLILDRDSFFDMLKKYIPDIKDPRDLYESYMAKIPGMEKLYPEEVKVVTRRIENWLSGIDPLLRSQKGINPKEYARQIGAAWKKLPAHLQRMLYDVQDTVNYSFISNPRGGNETAYFRPNFNGGMSSVHLSARYLRNDPDVVKTFFHELGHALNFQIGELERISRGFDYDLSGGSISDKDAYLPSNRFYLPLKAEFDAVIRRLTRENTIHLYESGNRHSSTDPISADNMSAVSDLFKGLSNSKYSGVSGHWDAGYYTNENLANELFAHLTAHLAVQDGLAEYFPEMVRLFKEFVRSGRLP